MKETDNGKDENKRQEEHLSPANIEDYNPLHEPNTGKNLNDIELQNRLDLYSHIGGEKEQFFKIQKIKNKYQKSTEERQNNNIKQDAYYSQGKKSSLPHISYEKLIYDREHEAQIHRNLTLHEAKSEYRELNSLRKEFSTNSLQEKYLKNDFGKVKDNDKEENDRER